MRDDRISRLVYTTALTGLGVRSNPLANFATARRHRGREFRLTAPTLGNREQT